MGEDRRAWVAVCVCVGGGCAEVRTFTIPQHITYGLLLTRGGTTDRGGRGVEKGDRTMVCVRSVRVCVGGGEERGKDNIVKRWNGEM